MPGLPKDRSASVRRWGAGLITTVSAAALLALPLSPPALAAAGTRSVPTASVSAPDDALARRFAPRIWLQQDESYFPSNVESLLNNTHVETHPDSDKPNQQFLVTDQALGCDSCTGPAFLAGQRPNQSAVPAYAEVVHRTDNGHPTNVTDIIYWMFYPYNNGKRVCIGVYVSRIGCLGGYSTFGNHVGDWENVTLRFVDGTPQLISLSQHDGGQTFPYGGKDVVLVGEHPVVYAAQGSHGLYADAGRHTYKRLPNGDSLNDDTSAGTLWDTQQALKVFAWQPVGSFTGEWSWLNYTGRWGNPKSGCTFSEPISGECVLDDGPVGPPMKAAFDPHMQPLDGAPAPRGAVGRHAHRARELADLW